MEYPAEILEKLEIAKKISSENLLKLDVAYGKWLGRKVSDFISSEKIHPDFVASHGYTVFHQPENNFTYQIGSGNEIFVECKIPVVYNFRQMDVSLGGQGAPLVPIGDQLLFGDYHYCLNLGGIANISTELFGKRIAYDIAPVNMILNPLAKKLGSAFDRDGTFASNGSVIKDLLDHLESLDYYKKVFPKSLGSEWVEENVISFCESHNYDPKDVLSTLVEHIALRISGDVLLLQHQKRSINSKILVTGGGTKNAYLINKIKEKLKGIIEVEIPALEIIDFKEALIFSFLGLLRLRNEPNCLASVTGASKDSSGGQVISDQNIIFR